MILFWALLIAFATVGLCVIVHYEALRLTSLLIPRLTIPPRPKVLVVIAAVFLAHLAEIVIFAVTYRLMQPFPQLGEIAGTLGCSRSQLALAWLYAKAPRLVAICGSDTLAYLDENLGALDLQPDAALVERIGALFAPGNVSGDRYHAALMQMLDRS